MNGCSAPLDFHACDPSLQVYLFAEALADGAVKMGMPSALAQSIASQTVLVSFTALTLLFHCSSISKFSFAYRWLWHFIMYWSGCLSCFCRGLGDCCVILGSIQLSSALRSAPQVEPPSMGFTPWSREVWGHRPWALWNLPLREPGSLAESLQQDAGNDVCRLPLNNLNGPYLGLTTNWILLSVEHKDKTSLPCFLYLIFSHLFS